MLEPNEIARYSRHLVLPEVGMRGQEAIKGLFPSPPPPGLVPSCAEGGVLVAELSRDSRVNRATSAWPSSVTWSGHPAWSPRHPVPSRPPAAAPVRDRREPCAVPGNPRPFEEVIVRRTTCTGGPRV